jgi:hypothetical protein
MKFCDGTDTKQLTLKFLDLINKYIIIKSLSSAIKLCSSDFISFYYTVIFAVAKKVLALRGSNRSLKLGAL